MANIHNHFSRILSDMLARHRKDKNSKLQTRSSIDISSSDGDEDAPSPLVLPSSTELFYFYGQSLEQCSKLFTGRPLFDLCNVHKKWLRIYAGGHHSAWTASKPDSFSEEVLVASLKRYNFWLYKGRPCNLCAYSPSNQPRKSTESRGDQDILKQSCLLINTADYCQTTATEVNIHDILLLVY